MATRGVRTARVRLHIPKSMAQRLMGETSEGQLNLGNVSLTPHAKLSVPILKPVAVANDQTQTRHTQAAVSVLPLSTSFVAVHSGLCPGAVTYRLLWDGRRWRRWWGGGGGLARQSAIRAVWRPRAGQGRADARSRFRATGRPAARPRQPGQSRRGDRAGADRPSDGHKIRPTDRTEPDGSWHHQRAARCLAVWLSRCGDPAARECRSVQRILGGVYDGLPVSADLASRRQPRLSGPAPGAV